MKFTSDLVKQAHAAAREAKSSDPSLNYSACFGLVMQELLTKKETKMVFEKDNGCIYTAQNDRFAWQHLNGGYLREKATNRIIYQMSYMKADEFGSDPVTDPEIVAAVRVFFAELREAQKTALEQAGPGAYPRNEHLAHR